jgi:regulatory protein
MKKDKAFVTQKDLALAKLKKFCAYRDRCHAEVRDKLIKLEIYGDDLEEVIAELILEGFLNEERYTRSFVRGKFRINHWGRNKIKQGLKAKKIPDSLIRLGMEEIDAEEYEKILATLLQKKSNTLKEANPAIHQKKLISYAMGRGFEYEVIRNVLDK